MTSHALNKNLQILLDATAPERTLTRYLFIVARGFDGIIGDLMGVLQAKNRTLFSAKQQSAQERLADLKTQTEMFPLGQIFSDGAALQKALVEITEAFKGSDAAFFREMDRQLGTFQASFEKLVRNPSGDAFASMLPDAVQLYTTLISGRQMLSTIRNVLQQADQPRADEDHLALQFGGMADYGSLVRKLGALESGYELMCRLVGIEPSAFPLRILKMEAPSLWISVIGERSAIALLRGVVERFCVFWFHRPVLLDREAAYTDRVLATQSLINLADELQRAGIRSLAPDAAEIREPALALRSVLIDLLENEPSMEVNGKRHQRDEQPDVYVGAGAATTTEQALHLLAQGGRAGAATSLVDLLRAGAKRHQMPEA